MSTRNVLDWLEEAAGAAPDAPAFDRPGGGMTWSAVRRKARCAGSMLSSMIPRQTPVLILMEKSPECLCFMFGAVYAGCFYTPLDSGMPEARMKLIAEKLQPAAESAKPATPAETTEVPAETAKADASERPADLSEGANRPEGFPGGGFSGGGGFPGGSGFPGGGEFSGTGGYSSSIWIQTAICAAVLLAAILIIRKAGNHNN